MRLKEILAIIGKNLLRPFNKGIRIVLPLLFHFFNKLNFQYVIAVILILYIKISTFLWKLRHLGKINKKNGYSILAFNREVFNRDLIELERRTDLNIVIFPNTLYVIFANTFLPQYLRSQICYHCKSFGNEPHLLVVNTIKGSIIPNYAEIRKIKIKFRNLIKKILPIIINKLKISALLSANVDYYPDQEWINACNEYGFPFLALDLESGRVDFEKYNIPAEDVDFKLGVYRVAVYCQAGKNSLIKSDGLKENQIVVTGFPRTDLVYYEYNRARNNKNIRKKYEKRKWVVLFDFKERDQKRLCEDTIEIFCRCAEQNTDKDTVFIIKTKGVGFTRDMVKFLKDKYGAKGKIFVDHNISFSDIACKAILLCGFTSTAIVKLMFTDIPVVIVNWAEALKHIPDNIFYEHSNSAYKMACSKEEFYRCLAGFTVNPLANDFLTKDYNDFRAARDKIIETHLFRIDGKRSVAVAEFIKKSILDFNLEFKQKNKNRKKH